MVERRGDRYYFLGRRSGVINVGGLKVYPEEVEAAINRHPAVRMSMVRSRNEARSPARSSPRTSCLHAVRRQPDASGVKREILQICHDTLAPHKVPATIRFVPGARDRAAPESWPVMRKVIVTGGSRGLGLGIVRRLVCEGYDAIASRGR